MRIVFKIFMAVFLAISFIEPFLLSLILSIYSDRYAQFPLSKAVACIVITAVFITFNIFIFWKTRGYVSVKGYRHQEPTSTVIKQGVGTVDFFLFLFGILTFSIFILSSMFLVVHPFPSSFSCRGVLILKIFSFLVFVAMYLIEHVLLSFMILGIWRMLRTSII